MRRFLMLFVAAAVSAEAPPGTDIDQFNGALATYRISDAQKIVDRLIAERLPADGIPRPDPLLNGMIGRLYLAANEPGEAAIYLNAAPAADLPQSMRAATALDRGRALELIGDREGALRADRAAAASSIDPEQQRRAQLAVARELLAENPAAARDQLAAIADGGADSHRWEARYLSALASSILGDAAAARRWTDAAWADTPAARVGDLAALRVETLRAGIAAAAADASTERAMLIATNGLDRGASDAMSNQLPVCGDAGITPSDFVIFGFVAGPFLTRELVPIAASRPSAVLPFYKLMSGSVPILNGGGETQLGTVFTVRCRAVTSAYYAESPPAPDPLTQWAVSRGLYYASAFNDADERHVKQVQESIATLEKRFGSNSALLILPRWQLLDMLQTRAQAGASVMPSELARLRTEVADGMKRAGAPEWLASTVDSVTKVEQVLRSAKDPTSASKTLEAVYLKQLLEAPFPMTRQLFDAVLESLNGDWPAELSRLVLDVDAHAPATLTGRERQAWKFTVANALRSLGRDAEASATLVAAGIPNESCAADDSPPKLVEQHFSYDNYPPELLAGGQQGAVLFEFGLSPQGTPTDPRIIYSLPAGLFDAVSNKGFPSLRYTPPTRGGAHVSCSGIYQPVRWQLEGGSVAWVAANLHRPQN